MSICVICGDYLLQSKQINTFLRSLRLQNIIILLKIMKERQIVMDLCTIFAHKVKIGCTLDEKQMEMQTLNKKADATREKDIYRVTVVGSVVNFLLLVFKFFAGIVGHSAAMLADAVHSLSDFITDIIVIVFVRISAKPEDEGHDYGHGKYETLATAIIGIFCCLWDSAFSGTGLPPFTASCKAALCRNPVYWHWWLHWYPSFSRKCFINIPYSRAGS